MPRFSFWSTDTLPRHSLSDIAISKTTHLVYKPITSTFNGSFLNSSNTTKGVYDDCYFTATLRATS